MLLPKTIRPTKRRKPIPARSNRIKLGAVWTRDRLPTAKDLLFAQQKARENIEQSRGAQPTIALKEALTALRVRYSQEEISWHHGTRFVLSDFWLPHHKVTIELDGAQHRYEQVRDAEKAKLILESRGFRTIRYLNREVLKYGFVERLRKDLGL